ncbi:hypothetical protein [Shewanella sp. Scap07]|uniref:hypothetical protein n=1 Tax=Shewanella sp. Scap07 TaxID=2589987 RepID=UPI0015C18A24|nr:hypothetical protein [Shewanella sp. Scap07]
MKPTTRYLAVVLSSVLLFGCNSSDDDDNTTPVPPPVDDTIGISDTTTLTASMQAASDLEKGQVTVQLLGDGDKAVTDASAFNLIVMGYPKDGQTTKYKLAWHQAEQGNCIDTETCSLAIDETDAGIYQLTLDSVDWSQDVESYRVAIEVKGEQAHLPLDFME